MPTDTTDGQDYQQLLGKWLVALPQGVVFRATMIVARENGQGEIQGETPDGRTMKANSLVVLHQDMQYLFNCVFKKS